MRTNIKYILLTALLMNATVQFSFSKENDITLDSECIYWGMATQTQKYDIISSYMTLSNHSLTFPSVDFSDSSAEAELNKVVECVDSEYLNTWYEFASDLKIYPVVSSCFNKNGWIK